MKLWGIHQYNSWGITSIYIMGLYMLWGIIEGATWEMPHISYTYYILYIPHIGVLAQYPLEVSYKESPAYALVSVYIYIYIYIYKTKQINLF